MPISWLWAHSTGSPQNDYAGLDYGSSTIATDAHGNSYVAGLIGGASTFGSLSLTASSYPAVCVAKFGPNGVCLWAKAFGGNSNDIYGNKGEAIDIDSAGNCYVTGTFNGSAGSTITLASGVTLTGTGARQIFVAKFSPAGVPLWAKQPAGTIANNYAKSIAADKKGFSYVTGYLGATGVTFGSTTLSGPGAFVAKYDPAGTPVWAVKIGSIGNTDGYSIAISPGGNCYVTGYFQSTDVFAGTTMTAIGTRDVFLAAVNVLGVLLWVKHFGFAGEAAYGRGVSTDNSNRVFLTGDFGHRIVFGSTTLVSSLGAIYREAFVVQFNSAGNVLWAKQTNGSQATQGNTIKAAAATGECYVAGRFLATGSLSLGSFSFSGSGLFVARFGVSGNVIWATRSGPPDFGESPLGISLDSYLQVYIAGNVHGPGKFGNHTVVAYGAMDALVAKLGDDGHPNPD